ncbi:MAG: tetratricopeptide repeat protein, partial [Caldilineae bacterium]
ALQSHLARLSLFRGGFTPLAAQAVVQVTVTELEALAAKSLVVHDPATDRYHIHPVIRSYAAEKLPEADPAIRRHAEYYLALLAQHRDALEDERAQSTIALLEPEIDNLRSGWQAGLTHRLVHLLRAGLSALMAYYQLRGLSLEGANLMHATRQAALTWGRDGVALAIQAGLAEARFQLRLGRSRPAIATLESTLALAQREEDRQAEGMVLVWWGEALWRAGETAEAQQKLYRALEIGRVLEDDEIIGWSHHQLGIVHDIQGRHQEALTHLQQARAIWESRQNIRILSNTLNSIGLVRCHQGDLEAAQETFEQALALCAHLDDRHLQTLLLNNLSLIAIDRGVYRSALDTLRQGVALATSTGNLAAQGEILLNMGRSHLFLGEIEAAREALEHALHIARSLGNRFLIAGALLYLAKTWQVQRGTSRAKSLYNQALAIAEAHNLQAVQCEALLSLTELLQEEGDMQQARSYAAQGLALAQALHSPRLLSLAIETGRAAGLSALVDSA